MYFCLYTKHIWRLQIKEGFQKNSYIYCTTGAVKYYITCIYTTAMYMYSGSYNLFLSQFYFIQATFIYFFFFNKTWDRYMIGITARCQDVLIHLLIDITTIDFLYIDWAIWKQLRIYPKKKRSKNNKEGQQYSFNYKSIQIELMYSNLGSKSADFCSVINSFSFFFDNKSRYSFRLCI